MSMLFKMTCNRIISFRRRHGNKFALDQSGDLIGSINN